MRVLPHTRAGKWAVGLIALWPLLTVAGSLLANGLYQNVEAGDGLIQDLRVRPALAVAMLAGIASGVASFAVSLTAIFRERERAVSVLLAALLGTFLVLLLAGEFFIEH